MLVQCFSEPDGRLTGFAFAVCSATHTAFARRRTMYATERTINRPGAQSDVAVAFRIDFRGVTMSIGTILLIILILALVGVIPAWGHSRSWGYGPSGIVGVVVVILIVLLLLGKL